MVGGAAAARPAQAAVATTDTIDTADTTSVDFPAGTLFAGARSLGSERPRLTIKFSVAASEAPEAANAVSPTDLADALNDFIASRGRPSITFYGTPAPAPLN
ncbi:hypothetical protein [Streptomyces prunicolor]|uniref:hypothetical protein n=1 Tax=Streptomyces prunicolor TaxID=67348 RepID=UPI00343633E9